MNIIRFFITLILDSLNIHTQASWKCWSIYAINTNHSVPFYVIFCTPSKSLPSEGAEKTMVSTLLRSEREAQSYACIENLGMQNTANLRGEDTWLNQ